MGGINVASAARTLKEGCDVVVGTAGRVLDFVQSGKCDVSAVRMFVVDEADRMCDREGRKAIEKIFARFSKSGKGTARLQVCGEDAARRVVDVSSDCALGSSVEWARRISSHGRTRLHARG